MATSSRRRVVVDWLSEPGVPNVQRTLRREHAELVNAVIMNTVFISLLMLRGLAPLAGMSTDEDLSEGSARRWTSTYRRRLAG